MDDNGEKNKVRDLFVSHEGKKEIFIDVGPNLAGIDYNWLFSQFSSGIKANIKNPEYADIVQVDRLEIETITHVIFSRPISAQVLRTK